MLFYFLNKNKTINKLRKNSSLTVKELAIKIKCDSTVLKRLDNSKLKDIPKELQEKLIPIFRGDRYNKVPW